MKQFYLMVTVLLAEYAFAEVVMPAPLRNAVIHEKALKVFPSEDKATMFIAVKVLAQEGTSVYTFFDEAAWRQSVDVSAFMPDASPDPKKQFSSAFCAMNAQDFELACSSSEELLVVDTSKPWFIPVATVPATLLSATVAELTRPKTVAVLETPVPAPTSAPPPVPVQKVETPATHTQPTAAYMPRGEGPSTVLPQPTRQPELAQAKPFIPYRVMDDGPHRQTIVWDDSPPPPPLPIPRVATDRR